MRGVTTWLGWLAMTGLCFGEAHAVDEPSEPAMSFFVATSANGTANLGGLAGADARCQALAEQAGSKGLTWHAYLSIAGNGERTRADARERIGNGPWYNAQGTLIARNLDELHGDRHHIDRRTALDAFGQRAETAPHDILTGSDDDGRLAFKDGKPSTCGDWTSDADQGVARIGHDDRMDANSHDNKRFRHWNGSWNSEHNTLGCSAARLADSGGGGGFYCFAVDGARVPAPKPETDPARYTFKRGVNLNHWLGDNIHQRTLDESMFYGAPWFTDEDVAWIADHGFDHIRVWVAGNRWVDSSGMLDEAMLIPFDRLLRWSRQHGLGVVLAMHGLPGHRNGVRFALPPRDQASPFTDEQTRGDAAYLWWLIAQRYRDMGEQLRFDLLAYPNAENAEQIRAYTSETLAAIRRQDQARIVYVTTRNTNANNLGDIDVDDRNVALTLSFFEPALFTRQFDASLPAIRFPGRVPDFKSLLGADHPMARASNTELTVEAVVAAVDHLAQEAKRVASGREVYISTFGTLGNVEAQSAQVWLRTVRAAFERNQLNWAVYDYFTGGAVRGGMNSGVGFGEGEPTHIYEALFTD